jgi:DNA-binding CsgD family transcriptional regulator
VALHRLDADGADPLAEAHDVLVAAHAAGYAPLVVDALDVVAGLALDAGRAETAVRLRAAAAAARDRLGFVPAPVTLGVVDAAAVEALDVDVRERARAEGASLDLDAAVAYARRSRGPRRRPASGWDSLTPTERDVVALAARGLRNRDIADQLLIGTGTVRTHLRRIFAKLDLTSRTELAAVCASRL